MKTSVTWSMKPRVVAVLAAPLLGWLAHWSFTNPTNPSEAAGWGFVAMALVASASALHMFTYRLEADEAGLTERRIWGTRRATWSDVLKVESIAQHSDNGAIYRSHASPEEAFHLVIHTKHGRFNTNRWMDGIDQFIEMLRTRPDVSSYRASAVAPLDRDDPSVKPALGPSPALDAMNRATDALLFVKLVVLVLPLSWIAGLIASLALRLSVSGNPFVDGTLLALVPWALGFVVYKWVEAARRRRFGAARSRPVLGARDAILTMASAIGGPMLLAGFAPRIAAASGKVDKVDIALALLGLYFCWIPIAEIRRQLARP